MWPFKRVWIKAHSEWEFKALCHCGELHPPECSIGPFMCSKCGCEETPRRIKGRNEWEQASWHEWRNHRFVEWAECSRKEEPNG